MSAETFLNGRVMLHCGDCLSVMDALAENSVDSCVTDPPYHLTSIVKRFGGKNAAPAKYGTDGAFARASKGFMSATWDGGDIAFRPDTWAEVLRVLKPGGYCAAFGAPRNFGRLQVALFEAGFEERDTVLSIADPDDAVVQFIESLNEAQLDAFMKCLAHSDISGMLAWTFGVGFPKSHSMRDIGRPELGTALKPAFEPIVLARKPLSEGTVAANVLRWGTGALNIGATRIPANGDKLGGGMVSKGRPKASEGWDRPWMHDPEVTERKKGEAATKVAEAEALGRWPANVVHDGSDEVVGAFPDRDGATSNGRKGKPQANVYGDRGSQEQVAGYADSGSAARFFYSAKASRADRNGSKHPTVKPIALMQWLARLITPPGGTVLDPFAGSGTTGEAAFREGFNAILIEREPEYQADIRRRMMLCLAGPDERKRESIKAKVGDKPFEAGSLFARSEAAE